MKLGVQRYIVQEDLDDLGKEDSSGYLGDLLQKNWDHEVANKKSYVCFLLLSSLKSTTQNNLCLYRTISGPLYGVP